MTKEYTQELAELERGLSRIQGIIKESKDRKQYQKATEAIHIQQARIDFLKRGYKLRDRELNAQKNLGGLGINEM